MALFGRPSPRPSSTFLLLHISKPVMTGSADAARGLDNCAYSRNRALVETLRRSGERKYHRRAWVLATSRVRLGTGVLVDPPVSLSPVSQMPLMSWYSASGNWESASLSAARKDLSAAT